MKWSGVKCYYQIQSYECECTLKALKLLLSGRLDRGVVTGIGFSKNISGFQVDTVVAQLNQTKPKYLGNSTPLGRYAYGRKSNVSISDLSKSVRGALYIYL